MDTALLLAAGRATRLRELRDRYAKACVPVAGRSALERLIPALAAAGVRRFVINLHWQAEQVRAQAHAAAPAGTELLFLEEGELLGTGGTLLASRELLGSLPDLVVNAKLFTDLDWAALDSLPPGSLVGHGASALTEFGGLHCAQAPPPVGCDAPGARLRGLWPREAPGLPAAPEAAIVFTGICRPAQPWLDALRAAAAAKPGSLLCLARHGFLAAADAHPVGVYDHPGRWLEISTPERLAAAEVVLKEAALPGPSGSASGRGAR